MKVKVGDKVKHYKKTIDKNKHYVTKQRKGTVIGVYPHIFNVVFDGKHLMLQYLRIERMQRK